MSSDGNNLIILEVVFETGNFSVFWLNLKLSISEYLDKNPIWNEMKEAFSVKLPTKNVCFCLKIKIKQNPGSSNKEYNEIFKHIHRLFQKWKNYWDMVNDWGNQWLGNYPILGRTWAMQGIGKQVWFVSSTVDESGGELQL